MSSFTITTPTAEVTLSPSKVRRKETAKGTVTYTVTNTSGVTVRTALRVKPGAGADETWFTVRGGEERDIGPGATENFAVELSVPGQRLEGGAAEDQRPKLSFHAVAVNLRDPDNDAEAGSTIAFRAPTLESGGGIKWWMIAAPAALVILVVAAIVAIPKIVGPDETVQLADYRNQPLGEARAALTELGLVVEERHQSGQPPALATRFYQQWVEDQDPPSDGTLMVAPGSRVSLIWEWRPLKVTVPDVSGKRLADAIQLIEDNGLRYLGAEPLAAPAPSPNHYPVVDRPNRTGEVDAGTGIVLSMRWQAPIVGGLHIDPNIALQEFELLRNRQSEAVRRILERER